MPRSVDHQKRSEIALAALDIVREHGLDGISMTRIASRLGMPRATLYWYFPDLVTMLGHAWGALRHEAVAAVAAGLVGKTHPLDMLEAVLVGEHAYWDERGVEDYAILLCQLFGAGDTEARQQARARIQAELQPTKALLAGALREGIREGTVADCDPEAIVDLVFAIQDGTMVHAALDERSCAWLDPLVLHLILDPLRRTP